MINDTGQDDCWCGTRDDFPAVKEASVGFLGLVRPCDSIHKAMRHTVVAKIGSS